ncbi:ferredoxin-NADP reductase [Streptomyces sp. B1I3]|nr:PDR/VanB family oxidoreductase [Streptomyces sp. B1I3]MDQ0798153.1 ferredoxin-NADP reductase [Streptomyces sp. B1I3]
MRDEATETELTVRVADRTIEADDVVVLELEDPQGGPLPQWEPGAHIDLRLPGGLIRQYSLCGDPEAPTWRIAVLRVPEGRGGSARVHDELQAGALIQVRGPRNRFPLVPAERYVFIAGGIGVTPILPMVAAAERAGAKWELHYGGRSRTSMAFLSDLEAFGDLVTAYPEDEVGLIDLDHVLDVAGAGVSVYSCGPAPLLEALGTRCAERKDVTLRTERFTARQLGDTPSAQSFEVELVVSGMTVTVPPDRSILEVVEDAGVEVLYSCQEGTCGTCETAVIQGEIDHRDSLLTPEERASNETMLICVSRAACPRLVLEL